MESFEQLYYESLPYVYALIAAVGLTYHKTSKVAVVAAFVLCFCSIYVLKMRKDYRKTKRFHLGRKRF